MSFVTYKKFFHEEDVHALVEILKESGIEYEVTEDRDSLDSLYGDKQYTKHYFVKIRQEDFSKADAYLLDRSAEQLKDADPDHYLYKFSDEELFDIVAKPDEWNEFDYLLAQKILKDRGKTINQDTVELLKAQRIRELSKPEERNMAWIYAGYILALLGGIIGIFIGWHISSFKRTLPNGQRVYAFHPDDRKHGWAILIIGSVMMVVYFAIRMNTNDF